MHSEALSQFCASIGLKIDEIILSPYIESEISEIKVTILPEKKNKDFRIFKCLMAKDVTNLSCRKYTLLKKTLKDINVNGIPNIRLITNLQYKINNFFPIQNNENGFFVEPVQKIKYVCEKFLLKNPHFSKSYFKLKLSADSTALSKKHLNLLNLTFNLLDDKDLAMNSVGCYILGKESLQNIGFFIISLIWTFF